MEQRGVARPMSGISGGREQGNANGDGGGGQCFHGRIGRASGGPGRDVAWVSGACLAARRGMVKEIGPLDEGFFMYYEDVDWCYRARAAGWRVVTVPGVEIRHDLGESAAQVSAEERARWAAESRVWFYEKNYSPGRARWLRAKMAASALLGGIWRLVPALFSPAARDGLLAGWARARAAVCGARAGRDRT